jgi:GTP-binding protein
MPKPVIAIVGRPNVGKSTLFNRILGERRAITADEPGTTRDRLVALADWDGRPFYLIDTGGFEPESPDVIRRGIREQALAAVKEADAVIFLVDATTGITADDAEVAAALRRSGKPVVLAANKADNPRREWDTAEFYRLGMGEPFPVSAHHNSGVADLMEQVLSKLPQSDEEAAVPEGMRITIVGRPNTGKSSLLNALVGKERTIVSEIPGTTRDSIDTVFDWKGEKITLIDTAGIRRRGRIEVGVESFSTLRSLQAIDRSDVTLLVLDATEMGVAQDTHIAGYAVERFKGLILVVNKWDMAKDLKLEEETVESALRQRFHFAPWAPIVFVSALKRAGLGQLMKAAKHTYEQRNLRIATSDLNKIIERAVGEHLPRQVGKRRLNILYATQASVNPPTFVFFCSNPQLVHFSYVRYLENRLRELFGFDGTPIRLVFKAKGER